jgi:methanogenic corrinoid protein MtbC1
MADFYFAISGIPALSFYSSLPLKGVMDHVERHIPKAVGFSVALPEQMKQVLEVAEAIREIPERPEYILVGGPAVRLGLY